MSSDRLGDNIEEIMNTGKVMLPDRFAHAWNWWLRFLGRPVEEYHIRGINTNINTHFCPPLRFRNQFLPTVPAFNGDDSALRALSSLSGLRGAPEVPPSCRETSVSRTANVGTVGMNGSRCTNGTHLPMALLAARQVMLPSHIGAASSDSTKLPSARHDSDAVIYNI